MLNQTEFSVSDIFHSREKKLSKIKCPNALEARKATVHLADVFTKGNFKKSKAKQYIEDFLLLVPPEISRSESYQNT